MAATKVQLVTGTKRRKVAEMTARPQPLGTEATENRAKVKSIQQANHPPRRRRRKVAEVGTRRPELLETEATKNPEKTKCRQATKNPQNPASRQATKIR